MATNPTPEHDDAYTAFVWRVECHHPWLREHKVVCRECVRAEINRLAAALDAAHADRARLEAAIRRAIGELTPPYDRDAPLSGEVANRLKAALQGPGTET